MKNFLISILEWMLEKLTGNSVRYLEDDMCYINVSYKDLDNASIDVSPEFTDEYIDNFKILMMIYINITHSLSFRRSMLEQHDNQFGDEEENET